MMKFVIGSAAAANIATATAEEAYLDKPFARQGARRAGLIEMRLITRTWTRRRSPPRSAFLADRDLPSTVLGPVEFSHGRQPMIACAWRARLSHVQPFIQPLQ